MCFIIGNLTQKEREAVILYLCGYRVREIAVEMKVAASAVSNYLLRARKKIGNLNNYKLMFPSASDVSDPGAVKIIAIKEQRR